MNPVLHRVIFGKMTHHFAVKPRRVTESSDVNVSLRKPAVELRTISGSWVGSDKLGKNCPLSAEPDCLIISCWDEHIASEHS